MTWQVKNHPEAGLKMHCIAGCRPGDPLADAIFCLTFARSLRRVRDECQAEGIGLTLPLQGQGLHAAVGEKVEMVAIESPAFMDDIAIPLHAPACRILEQVRRACSIVSSEMNRWGLTVNFKRKKTECLVLYSGIGSVNARNAHGALPTVREDDGALVSMLTFEGDQQIRIVQSYKHVGVHESTTPTPTIAVNQNVRAGNQACAAISRCLLSRPCLPPVIRKMAGQCAVGLRATYGAGTWTRVSDSLNRKLDQCLSRPWERIAATTLGTRDFAAPRKTHRAARLELQMP